MSREKAVAGVTGAWPNLVLAGFPKCGTSSLFEWLCLHPEVCGSTVKETGFLLEQPRQGFPHLSTDGLEAYRGYFQPTANQRIIMEATPLYADSTVALEVLPGLPETPRILFIVREPGARLLSQFRFLKFNLNRIDEETTFSQWLRTAQARETMELTRYVRHIDRWSDRFPAGHIRVMVFENLIRVPNAQMSALCRWLGLEGDFFDGLDLSPRNTTQTIRRGGLHRLALRLDPLLPRAVINRLLPLYYRIIARPAEPPDADDVARLETLRDEFREDNTALAERYDLDLSAWDANRPGAKASE